MEALAPTRRGVEGSDDDGWWNVKPFAWGDKGEKSRENSKSKVIFHWAMTARKRKARWKSCDRYRQASRECGGNQICFAESNHGLWSTFVRGSHPHRATFKRSPVATPKSHSNLLGSEFYLFFIETIRTMRWWSSFPLLSITLSSLRPLRIEEFSVRNFLSTRPLISKEEKWNQKICFTTLSSVCLIIEFFLH